MTDPYEAWNEAYEETGDADAAQEAYDDNITDDYSPYEDDDGTSSGCLWLFIAIPLAISGLSVLT